MNVKDILNERQYDLNRSIESDGAVNIKKAMEIVQGATYKEAENFLTALNKKLGGSKRKIALSKGSNSFEISRNEAKDLSKKINKSFEDGIFNIAKWKKFENDLKSKYSEGNNEALDSKDKKKYPKSEQGFEIEGQIDEMIDGIFKNATFTDYLLHNKGVNFFKSDVKLTKSSGGNNFIEVKRHDPKGKIPLGQIMSIRTASGWNDFKKKLLQHLAKKDNPKVKNVVKKLRKDPELLDKYAVQMYNRSYNSFVKNPSAFPAIINRIYTHFTREGDKTFLAIGENTGEPEVIAPMTKKYVNLEMNPVDKSFAPTSGATQIPRVNVLASFTKEGHDYSKKHNATKETRDKMFEELVDFTKEIING